MPEAGAAESDKWIRVNGVDTRYRFDGPENAPVLVLGHSLSTTLDMWRPQMAALQDRFRVLRYEVRGHGGTAAPAPPYSLDELADDLAGLLDALQIPTMHFVGLSMGGMIAQALAVRTPARFESLVLADTLSAYSPEAKSMWNERIELASGPDGMEPLVEPTLRRWFTEGFPEREPETADWIRSMIRQTVPAGFRGCCAALSDLDLTGRLGRLDFPCLVLVGEQDPTTPVSGAKVIHAALPDARLEIIPDAAHLSNVEQPAIFNELVGAFLDEQLSGRA